MGFYNKNKKTSYSDGFTLIETLVGSAIFLVVAFSGYQALSALMTAVGISHAKVAATALANERFEIIRNLPYQDVGIVAGIPVGKIQREETLNRDGYIFTVYTTIRNNDDPFDGTIGGSPNDSSPADYKLVDLDIDCNNCKTFPTLNFTTLVAPRALETASTNGALFVQVFDASGVPIPEAEVHIENTSANPDVIIDELTDNQGWVKIIDAPVGTNTYKITATKEGYSQEQTYAIGGTAGPNPLKPDATVVLQQVTQASFSIDELRNLQIITKDAACVLLPNINFSLTGTKLIGSPSYLKYSTQDFATSSAGNYTVQNLEWDTYSLALTQAAYDLAGMSSLNPFSLSPDEDLTVEAVVVPHASRALLVSVKDFLGEPIDGATVQLTRTGFNESKNTNGGPCSTPGQAFWNGLASGTYTLTVSKSGYDTYTNNALSVSVDWQNQVITLLE